MEVKTENKMVQRINSTLFKNDLPEKNLLFAKGRMAYVVSFDDEEGEVPTTLLRYGELWNKDTLDIVIWKRHEN